MKHNHAMRKPTQMDASPLYAYDGKSLYPNECPNCGPMYYDVSIDDAKIEEGILIVICECWNIGCDYKTKHIFKSEWAVSNE